MLWGTIAFSLLFLPAFPQDPQSIPPQEATNPDGILQHVREYVDNYLANLPNFICKKTTDQFEAGRKNNRWVKRNTLVSRVVFDGSREKQTLELVNGKPPNAGSWRIAQHRLATEGEFAVLLSNIFGENSHTVFQWKGWQDSGGRRLANFEYAIDQSHSTLKLSLSDLSQAILPYHGVIYADPDTGAIWHISNEIEEIPPELKTRSFGTSIDYGKVTLGGSVYLLPENASVHVDTGSGYIRHDLYFRDYRKFEAQSTITFQSDNADGNTPEPKSGQSEKPPILER